jgi:hypothetical protein
VLAFERHYQTEIQGEYWVFRRLGLVSRDDLQILKKKKKAAMFVNPSYSGYRGWEDQGLRPVWAKS